ncbi:uncharacterized protein J4E88_010483 [Alternaria novae-zelandiae]|uniref:uncharacterized protein n=1 Tax=Alternaria novae-zelandiae TaxID=430562 RepID=UPI0020C5AA1A|nr:uncharacterized protein J4E88_010483 [Alternaria novae-zelandiae]KAI4666188.1 hypothetical protein J4E88_010483 [Alternaria novae-zelandiae]
MISSNDQTSSAAREQNATNPPVFEKPPTSTTPLPPDVAAARKARMNADLIGAFKSTCPPGTTPHITGVGLYTHVEGAPPHSPMYPDENPQPQPEFFPIRIPESRGNESSQPDEEVQKLWNELELAVETEEELIATTELGLKELRKRYRALPPPKNSRSPVQRGQQQQPEAMQGDTSAQGGTTTSAGSMSAPSAPTKPRGQSLASVMSTLAVGNENTSKGGTEPERGRSTTTSTTGFYAPDPRRQGR